MTIYVDQLTNINGKLWCHMTTDQLDLSELHKFAIKLGLKRNWFQNDKRHPHYDLTPNKRSLAIIGGAAECSSKDLIDIMYDRLKKGGITPRMLLIIDGNNLAHRAKHVFSLSNKGVDVSVTYGFLRVLESLMFKYKPDSVVVCFDGGTPEFRRQYVPEYKANRHLNDDPTEWEDFNRQIDELAHYALPMMGIVVAQRTGAEADDLMYHASRLHVGNSIVVTGDKDLLQAVCEKVSVLQPSKEKLYTVDNFEELVGINLKQYVDWRAIQGDGSDNIPGIPGIGEKTATKLFQTFGSLTNIVNAALGHHPTQKLEGKLAINIASFGWERITKNIYITALYADRVGAKQAVVDAVGHFHKADKDRIKKYFMRNGFLSLMEGKFYNCVARLMQPELDTRDTRFPIPRVTRKAVV